MLRLLDRHHLVAVVNYFSIIRAVFNLVFIHSLNLVISTRERTRVLHELFLRRRSIYTFFTVSRMRVGHALLAMLRRVSLFDT